MRLSHPADPRRDGRAQTPAPAQWTSFTFLFFFLSSILAGWLYIIVILMLA